MRPKLKTPWHYLIWRNSNLSADQEVAVTRLTRREGFFYMLRICWLLLTEEDASGKQRFTVSCAWIFLSQNYPLFVCLAGYLLTDIEAFGVVGMIWLATFVYGSLRYVAWLIALLFRWPPMAKG